MQIIRSSLREFIAIIDNNRFDPNQHGVAIETIKDIEDNHSIVVLRTTHARRFIKRLSGVWKIKAK